MGKNDDANSVSRTASYAAWMVSNRASDARRYAYEAEAIRDELTTAQVSAHVLADADELIARVHAAARDAMSVWEDARALLQKCAPETIEHEGDMYVLGAPRRTSTNAPTAADVRYTDARQAMARGRAALDDLIALAIAAGVTTSELHNPQKLWRTNRGARDIEPRRFET